MAPLKEMYIRKKKSSFEVSQALGVSESNVNYWLQQYGIRKRTLAEAMYVKHNPGGDPFHIRAPKTHRDYLLLGLGLGLWWGEGTKRNRGSVRLGNTDPALIKAFMVFLDHVCGVQREKMHFGLQIFSDMDPEAAKRFWQHALDIRDDQFYKIIVTRTGSIGTYRQKTAHGVLTVYVNNVKLRSVFDRLMEQYVGVSSTQMSPG